MCVRCVCVCVCEPWGVYVCVCVDVDCGWMCVHVCECGLQVDVCVCEWSAFCQYIFKHTYVRVCMPQCASWKLYRVKHHLIYAYSDVAFSVETPVL